MTYDSQRDVLQLDPNAVAAAILGAAGWARVGVTMRDENMRARAAQELALTILDQVAPRPRPDPRQLALFR